MGAVAERLDDPMDTTGTWTVADKPSSPSASNLVEGLRFDVIGSGGTKAQGRAFEAAAMEIVSGRPNAQHRALRILRSEFSEGSAETIARALVQRLKRRS